MAIVNLQTASDADFVKAFAYQDAAENPISLVGSSLAMTVRRRAADSEVMVAISTDSGGIVITNAALGLFTITLPLARLSRMSAGDYVHSLIRTRADGLKDPIWHGSLTHAIGPTR